MLNNVSLFRVAYASLKRVVSTAVMQTSTHHHRTAFTTFLPLQSRVLSDARIHPMRRYAPVVTHRRPRARLVRAQGTEPEGPAAMAQDVSLSHSRAFATLPETLPEMGEDGLPIVKEDDLEEQFVRGSGPGGQKINKTASCVVLKHVPTGVTVRCQESRSQTRNRQLARRILQRKLDEMIRGKESLAARELSRARARKAKRRKRSIKKHFKSRRDKAMMDSRMGDF